MKHRNKIWIGSLFLGMLFIHNACYYDQVVPVEIPIGDVGEISFSEHIIPTLNVKCSTTGCHNGSVAPDLRADRAFGSLINGNYINISDPASSELYQWMRGNRSLPMPLSGPDATDNAKILAWIEQGALNN